MPCYFHPWSRSEIDALASLHTISLQDVQARWELFGGVPRYVFAGDNYQYFVARRKQEISNFSIQSLCLAFCNRKDPKDSHMILHEYSTLDVKFASKVTRREVFNYLFYT